MVKNLPANAGDMGSILSRTNVMEQLSQYSTTADPVLYSLEATIIESMCPRFWAPQQEKPAQWEAHTPQLESNPNSLQLEKSLHSKDPVQPKININK